MDARGARSTVLQQDEASGDISIILLRIRQQAIQADLDCGANVFGAHKGRCDTGIAETGAIKCAILECRTERRFSSCN